MCGPFWSAAHPAGSAEGESSKGVDRDLEIVGVATMGGLTKWRAAHPGKLGAPCANCAAPLAGPYCHNCGQLAEDFDRSILSLFVEAFENLFHTDGRLLQTLPRLILRPAALTRDYLAGRRASQMPPLRLFLVVILLFFFVGSVREFAEPSHVEWVKLDAPAKAPPEVNLGGGPTIHALGAWLKPRVIYVSAHQREFAMGMESWLHRIAILFLPISTLLLSLLFVFQRRFFIFDHAIFSMHSLSFMGLLFTVITLVAMAPPLRGLAGWLTVAAPTHLFFHLRGYYQTSIAGTLIRMFLLLVFSVIAVVLLLGGVAALELNGMGGAAT